MRKNKTLQELWRHDARGIEKERVECTYQACEWCAVKLERDQPEHRWCVHPKNKEGSRNLWYWSGLIAPNWCMKRKINGGWK